MLSITPSATAGKVTGSAECDGIKKSINLVLKSLGNANKVEFYSDEVVYRGTSKYMAITISDGVVITACDTKWEIFNNTEGVSMSNDGTLTVSDSTNDYIAVVKVFGENKKLIKENKIAIGELTDGVQKINTEYEYLKNGYLIISVLFLQKTL